MPKLIHCAIVFMILGLNVSCNYSNLKETNDDRPNILLIVADDLGYTDLGCYGSEILTPNLDTLARSGIMNTAFYTAATCSPTRAMLLSGVDNHRNGYGTMEGDWAENQIGKRGYEGHLNYDVVTFPKLLQDNGYHTSIAGKWHQAFPPTEQSLWPAKRGFDRSFCLMQGGAGHFGDQQRLFSFFDRTYYTEDDKIVEKLPEDFYSSDYYADKVIEYIEESGSQNKPFFSYLAFTAPHWPLQVRDEDADLYKGQYDEGYEALAETRAESAKKLGLLSEGYQVPPLTPNVIPWEELGDDEKLASSRTMEIYAAMIERLDWNVGKVIKHLKSIGQYENTLIIFMADNGAEGNSIWTVADTREWVAENFDNSPGNMGKKDSYIITGPSWAQVSSLPFKWYKSFASEGGVRCPSIISFPGWDGNFNKVNNDYLSVMDIAPTILELTGIQHPKTDYKGRKIYPMDGTSMLSWLEGKDSVAHAKDEVHCWELYGRRAVLKGNWKATWLDIPYGKNEWELYNLDVDPGELNDLSADNPEVLTELKQEWDQYATEYNVILPSEKVAYGSDDVWRGESE